MSNVQLYVVPRHLPDHLRPAYASRRDGVTIAFIDPRTPRAEAVQWSVENFTVPERQHIRAVMGQPPIGYPLDDWIMDDPVCEVWPEALLHPRYRSRAVV